LVFHGSFLLLCDADERLGRLVRKAFLFGKSYGIAQIDGKLTPSLNDVNDWLISNGIEPFAKTAKNGIAE